MSASQNSFKTRSTLAVNGKNHTYYSLTSGEIGAMPQVARLPVSVKVLLENLLRHEDGKTCTP